MTLPHLSSRRYSVSAESPHAPTVSVVSFLSQMPAWWSDPRRHCARHEKEEFFGDDSAVAICRGYHHADRRPCPFIKECLDFAIENHELGVWGGTSERGRRKIAKQRKQGLT